MNQGSRLCASSTSAPLPARTGLPSSGFQRGLPSVKTCGLILGFTPVTLWNLTVASCVVVYVPPEQAAPPEATLKLPPSLSKKRLPSTTIVVSRRTGAAAEAGAAATNIATSSTPTPHANPSCFMLRDSSYGLRRGIP